MELRVRVRFKRGWRIKYFDFPEHQMLDDSFKTQRAYVRLLLLSGPDKKYGELADPRNPEFEFLEVTLHQKRKAAAVSAVAQK